MLLIVVHRDPQHRSPISGVLMRDILLRTLAVGLLCAAAINASAVTDPATTTFTVTATVLKACTTSATNIAFGNYTPTGGVLNATGVITVNCTVGTTGTVSLNGGLTGTITQRLMTGPGTVSLEYNLYTTVGDTTVWGNGITGSTQNVTGAGLAAANAQTFTVYGNLPDSTNNQTANVGSFSDTITVSVAY
jgi:spore coat protein U-like protein